MPTLYQNILDFLPSDLARRAFLWATEQSGNDQMCYRAEAFAREVHSLSQGIAPMLAAGSRLHGLSCHDPGLWRFILDRHTNWRWGGNKTPTYSSNDPQNMREQ